MSRCESDNAVPQNLLLLLVVGGIIGLLVWQNREPIETRPSEPKPTEVVIPDEPTVEPVTVENIEWISWQVAPTIARKENKPAYIHFTRGKSCAPCENLRRNVYTNQAVVAASKNFVCVKFDLDDVAANDNKENKAALAAFGIDRETNGIPQDVFIVNGWRTPFYVVLGQDIPSTASDFVDYFSQWQTFTKLQSDLRK